MSAKQSKSLSPSSELSNPTNKRNPIAWAGFYELTKPRLSLLSVITALVGYLAALPILDGFLIFHFVTGTALCAAGAASLNQWWEREPDAVMERTRERPLPARQIKPENAFLFGLLLSIAGSAQLFFGANPLAGILGAATISSYLLIYTPMKKATRWATEVGAVPGAIPPLIGWAAAEGTIAPLGWILFAILAVWQIPHFMAIAWMYRSDYERGGFPMLSVIDKEGNRVARWALVNTCLLLLVTALPCLFGYCQWIYGVTAIGFGFWFLKRTIAFMKPEDRDASAKRLFFNSIIYLPAVLFSLVIDRWILG